MARVCTSKVVPAIALTLGLGIALTMASKTPTITLLKDNLRVINMPIGEWIHLMWSSLTRFVAAQTLLTLALFALGLYITIYLYQMFFAPMNVIVKPGDVGYILDDNKKSDVVNEVRRRRKAGQLPPIYPNGWIPLIASQDLKKGEAKYIGALGNEFAIYRGQNGEAFVVDAYCPHLGANIAVGGTVKGDCLVCPFHGWAFEGQDGKCVNIPYQEKDRPIPNQAKIRAWKCLEKNGMILVWHDVEGREPSWFPENMETKEEGKMYYHGRTEHRICAHVEEISENGADCSHLDFVHTPFVGSGTDLRYMWSKFWGWANHSWGGEWHQDPDDPHIGVMTVHHQFRLFGLDLAMTKTESFARQNGPAHVLLHLTVPFGRTTIVISVTPVEALVQKVTQQVYGTRFVPRWFAKIFLYAEYKQFERDIMVWNYKTYLSKPVLVSEDKLISKHRRWYSQFFSKNSPRYGDRKESLDW